MYDMTNNISVIIPAYNAEKYLTSTIESIVASAYNQIIIVDDGSKDDTLNLAYALSEMYSNIEIVSQKNQGVSAARNMGFSHAKCEYVLFLDADDLLFSNAIAQLKSVLDSNKQAVAAYGKVSYIDKSGDDLPLNKSRKKHLSKVSPNTLIFSNFIDTLGAMLIRADVVKKTGGFDTTLKAAEDWEFYNRLIKFGDILFADIDVCKYRLHQNSAMSNLSLASFNLAAVKVHHQALKNGHNRIRLANASTRRLSNLYLVFARREKSAKNRAFLSLKSIFYIFLSLPFYFSLYQFLQSCKMLLVSSMRMIFPRNNA